MKIIIAGAGHGGLVAGARLANAGNDVTVVEMKQREELGHDWEDRFTFDLLARLTEQDSISKDYWRYRGDCAFVSPSYNTRVIINYNDENRQRIMWRKPVINMLLDYAKKSGVKFCFGTRVLAPIVDGDAIIGLSTSDGDVRADLVIDASGVFSPVRSQLPEHFNIERAPQRGDVFYAYRAYFERKADYVTPAEPFEIYLCHEKEQGLSWVCINEDSVDILIGRIDELDSKNLNMHIDNFKKSHLLIGDEIVHGGNYGVIPVRRPLALMVARGYAAVGDSAFMTTPMNGMGIDLSLLAGELLSDVIISNGNTAEIETLWQYNKRFHKLYGGDTAKNEGLKNSLLELPGEGVDFLFDNGIIQASDLSGAGSNTNLSTLLGKFVNGMKNPKYFFAVLGGLMKGSKLSKALKNAPEKYNPSEISAWQNKVNSTLLRVTRK